MQLDMYIKEEIICQQLQEKDWKKKVANSEGKDFAYNIDRPLNALEQQGKKSLNKFFN